MNWTEFNEWLSAYPKIITASTNHESYQKTEVWNGDAGKDSNYKEGETIVIHATPFRVTGLNESDTQEKLINGIVEVIGDGTDYKIWIRQAPEVVKRRLEDVWDGYARIAYILKSELIVK